MKNFKHELVLVFLIIVSFLMVGLLFRPGYVDGLIKAKLIVSLAIFGLFSLVINFCFIFLSFESEYSKISFITSSVLIALFLAFYIGFFMNMFNCNDVFIYCS